VRILGIDPGYAIVGWGAVEYRGSHFSCLDYGAVTTPAGLPLPQRLAMIYTGVGELFQRFAPEALSIEKLYFTNNKTTGIAVAEARGVILLCAAQHGLEVCEYTPMQVKQAVVGYGKATKSQVMEMTRRLLGLEKIPRPDDAADALAMAICQAHTGSSALTRLGLKP